MSRENSDRENEYRYALRLKLYEELFKSGGTMAVSAIALLLYTASSNTSKREGHTSSTLEFSSAVSIYLLCALAMIREAVNLHRVKKYYRYALEDLENNNRVRENQERLNAAEENNVPNLPQLRYLDRHQPPRYDSLNVSGNQDFLLSQSSGAENQLDGHACSAPSNRSEQPSSTPSSNSVSNYSNEQFTIPGYIDC